MELPINPESFVQILRRMRPSAPSYSLMIEAVRRIKNYLLPSTERFPIRRVQFS